MKKSTIKTDSLLSRIDEIEVLNQAQLSRIDKIDALHQANKDVLERMKINTAEALKSIDRIEAMVKKYLPAKRKQGVTNKAKQAKAKTTKTK